MSTVFMEINSGSKLLSPSLRLEESEGAAVLLRYSAKLLVASGRCTEIPTCGERLGTQSDFEGMPSHGPCSGPLA